MLDAAYTGIVRNTTPINGGFGGAPKFPPAMTLEFCFAPTHRTGDATRSRSSAHT